MIEKPPVAPDVVEEIVEQPFNWRRKILEYTVVLGILCLVAALLLPSVRRAPEAARRTRCRNNLKQISIALHDYYDDHGVFPPTCTLDATGKPLHSWRTLLLPYLDQQALYDKIDFSKPWDDPANAAVLAIALPVYRCPGADVPQNHTTYMAVVAPNSFLHPTKTHTLEDVTDGANMTLMLMEVAISDSVPWMEPRDTYEVNLLSLDENSEMSHTSGGNAAFVDGHVKYLSVNTPAEARKALISIAGDDNLTEE